MCSEEGHNSKECEKPLTEEFLATITCRRCDKTGHMSADCPERPKFLCRNCDAEGHGSRDCPVSPPLPNPTSIPSALSPSHLLGDRFCGFCGSVLTGRNLPIWTKSPARNVTRLDILHATVPIRNVATVKNPATTLAIALYPHLSFPSPFPSHFSFHCEIRILTRGRNPAIRKTSSAGTVSKWDISPANALNLEPTPAASATTANLLVPSPRAKLSLGVLY